MLTRVLGVDDFSLRKGHTYATVLVDMEAGVPVDVLPDREAATLEAWLQRSLFNHLCERGQVTPV